MTDHKVPKDEMLPPHPSQAEGRRDTDPEVQGGTIADQPPEGKDVIRERPSQAEGSEETIEASLND